MEDIKTPENTDISLDEVEETSGSLFDISLDEVEETTASLLGVLCANQRLVYRTDVAALLARLGIQLSFIPLNEADAKSEVSEELTRLGIK
jgi:hypothetical protein